MKVKKLIRKLQELEAKHGNVKVTFWSNEYDIQRNNDGYFEPTVKSALFTDKDDESFCDPITGGRIQLSN